MTLKLKIGLRATQCFLPEDTFSCPHQRKKAFARCPM